MDKLTTIQLICIWALPILFAVTLHEAAHGWVAHLLGDDTAYKAGRVSANPLKHIDFIGTVLVPIFLLVTTNFIFGWAKPVPVDARNLQKPRSGTALVALAGPVSNFLMAFIWMVFFKLGSVMLQQKMQMAIPLILMSEAGVRINAFLVALNILPIPPLDGSRVVSSVLPARIEKYYNAISPFGFIILLILLLTNILGEIMFPLAYGIVKFLQWLFQ